MREEFSIIVPVYNREKLVVRCLESIKAQTYRPLHVIVVDNGSSDDTFSAVTSWGSGNTGPGFRMSILRENTPGASAARNTGLGAVAGDYLMFLDSDDEIHPELVERAMATFRDNPGIEIVSWRSRLRWVSGKSRQTRSAHFKDNLSGQIIHCLLRTGCYAIERRLLNRAGTWDQSIRGWTGWEFGIRLLLAEPGVIALDETLTDIYRHAESISGGGLSQKRGLWEHALKRGAEDISDSERTDIEYLMRLIDYRRVILAAYYRREGNLTGARELLQQSLGTDRLTELQRKVLKICYKYTCLGGLGASYFARMFL